MLEDGKLLNQLNNQGERLRQQLREIFERRKQAVQVTGVSSLWHTHFTKENVVDARVAPRADREKLVRYHEHLLEKGVFFLPTKSGSLSTAHTKADLEKLLAETEEYLLSS
jgi:glutamate-1-semialdehyde aminotransferase